MRVIETRCGKRAPTASHAECSYGSSDVGHVKPRVRNTLLGQQTATLTRAPVELAPLASCRASTPLLQTATGETEIERFRNLLAPRASWRNGNRQRERETQRLGMVLIHGGNAASAPALLPSIVPASPSRTAPARERKKWSPIGSPLSASADDPSSSGTGLHQWMEELSGPSGPIGMQIPREQLPFRSSARSHRPLTCDPPHRCTSPDPNTDPSPSPSPSPNPNPEQVHVPLRAADLRQALAAHAGQGPSLARRPDRRAEQRGRAPAHQGARAEQGGAARQSARQGGAAAREATEAAAASEPGGAG